MRISAALGVLAVCSAGQAADADSSIESRGQQPSSENAKEPAAAITRPMLKQVVHPEYPAGATATEAAMRVVLKLTIDAHGNVIDAKVVSPGNPSLDQAALEASRNLLFEPARRGDHPVPAIIDFSFEFSPPRPPESSTLQQEKSAVRPLSDKQAAPLTPEQTGISILVTARRPELAASALSIPSEDFHRRPLGSATDILRLTPGLVAVQHAGGGKANQYFLRGFDSDHGTDVALSFDGIPINLVSHAHGQGYADSHFIIPEIVSRIEIDKGPYLPRLGDFATAGAMNLVSADKLEQTGIGVGFEVSPGHGTASYRTLLTASPKLGSADTILAADLGRYNGPFESPNHWDSYRSFAKWTLHSGSGSSLALGISSYAGSWHGSGQIPDRAVSAGQLSRFGSFDPSEGGGSARHQAFAQYRAATDDSEIYALAYLASYRFNLFSNFTLYLRDPENGDQIEQDDRRTFYGGKLSYRLTRHLSSARVETTLGVESRSDLIRGQLWHSLSRTRLSALRDHDIRQDLLSAYLNQAVLPAPWLSLNLGARFDFLSFSVDDRLARAESETGGSGTDSARQFSPKMSAVVDAIRGDQSRLELFADYGHGFHSNDVRGAFASPKVSPLARAAGAELGARGLLLRNLQMAASVWRLDLQSETVWSGDEGTTETAGATRRYGVELETRYRILPWLSANVELTFTKSRFLTGDSGQGLPLAPKQTWSGGLSAHGSLAGGQARAALSFFGMGARPASDDGGLVAPGFTEFDASLGYRRRSFEIALDLENLLNAEFPSAVFASTSRLPTEPAGGSAIPAGFSCGPRGRLASAPSPGGTGFFGCEDLHFTPANPFTIRTMATLFLD